MDWAILGWEGEYFLNDFFGKNRPSSSRKKVAFNQPPANEPDHFTKPSYLNNPNPSSNDNRMRKSSSMPQFGPTSEQPRHMQGASMPAGPTSGFGGQGSMFIFMLGFIEKL